MWDADCTRWHSWGYVTTVMTNILETIYLENLYLWIILLCYISLEMQDTKEISVSLTVNSQQLPSHVVPDFPYGNKSFPRAVFFLCPRQVPLFHLSRIYFETPPIPGLWGFFPAFVCEHNCYHSELIPLVRVNKRGRDVNSAAHSLVVEPAWYTSGGICFVENHWC